MKLLRNKKIILIYIIILIVTLLSRWKIFTTSGIIGHNWDWLIPFLPEQNRQAILNSFFIWSEQALGFQDAPRVHSIILSFMGALVNGEVQTKFLLFSIPFFAFSNSFIFLSSLAKKYLKDYQDEHIFFGAFVYAYSPIVFNDIIGGQLIYLLGYAVFPLYTYLVFKIFESRYYLKYTFLLVLTFWILSGSLNYWFAFAISFSIFIFFYKKEFKKYILIVLLSLFSSFYIPIYIFLQIGNFKEVMPESLLNIEILAQNLRSVTQTIDKVFIGAGYADRNLFLNSLGNYRFIFYFISYSILIFILSNLLFNLKYLKNKKLFFWAIAIYFLSLFLVTGGRDPLGGLFIFVMQKVTFFRVFRTFFHFFVLLTFSYSILIIISLSLQKLKSKKIVPILLIFFFLLSILPIFIEGDNGMKKLKSQHRDSIDIYKINPEYLKILKSQFKDPEWYRILYIPTTVSPIYKNTPYQRSGQGGDPEVIYSPKPIFDDFALINKSREIYSLIENNFIDRNAEIDQKLLGLFSFRKIIYKKDVEVSFSAKKDEYNDKIINDKLKKTSTILTSQYVDYYNLNNKFFIPHVYTPKNIIITDQSIKKLPQILLSLDYKDQSAIYLNAKNNFLSKFNDLIGNEQSLTTNEPILLEIKNTPILEYKRINPTKYRIAIHQADSSFPFIFSESFNNNWKAYIVKHNTKKITETDLDYYNENSELTNSELLIYITKGWISSLGDFKKERFNKNNKIKYISQNFKGTIQNNNLSNGKVWETWFVNIYPNKNNKIIQISDENHLIVNGYANSWIINPKNLCSDNNLCIKNSNNTYDLEMIIEYKPQTLYYLGFGISLITFLFSIVCSIIYWLKEKIKRNEIESNIK